MRVLVALDETESALRAGRAAVRLFGDPGAEFVVMSVTPAWWLAWGPPLYPTAALAPLLDPPNDDVVAERARQLGIADASLITETGDPVECIVNAADAYDVDVIVVGGRDKGVIGRILEPSVSQGVVRATHRPVLVVTGEPPPEAASA